jgi:hypothetical protein
MNSYCATMTNTAEARAAEVSGWDAEGQFFVEIANLEETDETGETIVSLRHHVHTGSLLFVKLLPGASDHQAEKSHPTPHEAQAAQPPGFRGRSRVRLISCRQRPARKSATLWTAAASKKMCTQSARLEQAEGRREEDI